MHLRILLVALCLIATVACGTDTQQDNQPPSLELDVGSEVTYTLGDVIRVTMSAADPEGHQLSFSVENVPDRAVLQASASLAVFTWDPLASDITPEGQPLNVVFVVKDAQGARTERRVGMNIRPGSGVPRFVSNTSYLHNVANGPVVFDVEVRDDDSSGVSIAMPSGFAPTDSELTLTGPFSARFGWAPSPEQLQRRVHTVKFIANDGENPPVEQVVSIILKKDAEAQNEREWDDSCRFEAAVEFESLKAQRTSQPFEITAKITDEGKTLGYDRLLLNWTTEDVWNDSQLPWQSIEMTPTDSGFLGRIPNPVLMSGSQEIYYEICAVNDDADDQDPQAYLCGPTSLFDSFIVYPPGVTECEDDWQNNGDFDLADGLENAWILGRLCVDSADHFELSLGTGQEATVFVVYPTHSTPTIEVYDADRNRLPDPVAGACPGYTDLNFDNSGAPTKFYIVVRANDVSTNIPFQILAQTRDMENPAECLDAQYEPNDTTSNATQITTDSASFTGLEICRSDDVDIFAFQAPLNQRIQIQSTFSHEIADVDLRLFKPSQQESVSYNSAAAASSLGVTDSESIDYVTTESGTHYLVVYSNGPNRYTLNVSQSPSETVACIDNDAFGSNHSQATAGFVADGIQNNLKICPDEDDWYSFPVLDFTSETFEVDVLAPMGELSNMTLEIWDIFGVIDDGVISAGILRANATAFSNDNLYIRVSSTQPANYSLDLKVMFP